MKQKILAIPDLKVGNDYFCLMKFFYPSLRCKNFNDGVWIKVNLKKRHEDGYICEVAVEGNEKTFLVDKYTLFVEQ